MAISAVLMAHVAAGGVGLAAGAGALMVRKGGRLHRMAGAAFVASMLFMAGVGTAIAVGMAEPLAIVPGLVTFYLVATAWGAVRRADAPGGRFEAAGFWFGTATGVLGVALAFGSSPGVGGTLVAFSLLVAFAAWRDRRVIQAGGVTGP